MQVEKFKILTRFAKPNFDLSCALQKMRLSFDLCVVIQQEFVQCAFMILTFAVCFGRNGYRSGASANATRASGPPGQTTTKTTPTPTKRKSQVGRLLRDVAIW